MSKDSGFPMFDIWFWYMAAALVNAAKNSKPSGAIDSGIAAMSKYLRDHPEIRSQAPKCFLADSVDAQERTPDEIVAVLQMLQLGSAHGAASAAADEWRAWPTRPR